MNIFPEILWHIQHHQNSNVDNGSPRPVQFYPLTESDFGFSNEENMKFPEKMDSLSAHTKIPLLYQTEILGNTSFQMVGQLYKEHIPMNRNSTCTTVKPQEHCKIYMR